MFSNTHKNAYTEIQNLIKKLPKRTSRKYSLWDVSSIFRDIFYDSNKYESLTEAEQKSVLKQIDSYIDDLKDSSFLEGKSIYAWVSEKKWSFCENKEEATKIFNEILSSYRTIFKDKPKWGHWLIRINYLNFLSHNTPENCLKIAEDFFNNKDTFERKPTSNELAKLYNILAISYIKKSEQESELKKSLEDIKKELQKSLVYINKAIKSDPNYPGIYSTAGHAYLILANTERSTEKRKQLHEKSKENFDKAMELDRMGFNRKHPLGPHSSQVKVAPVQTDQPNITTTTTTTTPKPENAWNGANLAKHLLSQEGCSSLPTNQQTIITTTITTTTTPKPENAWNGANLAKHLLSQKGCSSLPTNQQGSITTTTTTTSHDKEASRKAFEEKYPMRRKEYYQSSTPKLINKPIEKMHEPVLMSKLREEDFLKIYISTKGEEEFIFRKIYISPKGKYIFHDSKRNVYEGEIDKETLKKIDQSDFRSSLFRQISTAHTPKLQNKSKANSQDESKTDLQNESKETNDQTRLKK